MHSTYLLFYIHDICIICTTQLHRRIHYNIIYRDYTAYTMHNAWWLQRISNIYIYNLNNTWRRVWLPYTVYAWGRWGLPCTWPSSSAFTVPPSYFLLVLFILPLHCLSLPSSFFSALCFAFFISMFIVVSTFLCCLSLFFFFEVFFLYYCF